VIGQTKNFVYHECHTGLIPPASPPSVKVVLFSHELVPGLSTFSLFTSTPQLVKYLSLSCNPFAHPSRPSNHSFDSMLHSARCSDLPLYVSLEISLFDVLRTFSKQCI
jgi:hypothetical protein